MKIILTSDLVIEQIKEPILAWTVISYNGGVLKEPFSDTEFILNKLQYKYIDVEEKGVYSFVNGFRCYETERLAEFYKRQYADATEEAAVCYKVFIPVNSHVIRYEGEIYSNEWIINGN